MHDLRIIRQRAKDSVGQSSFHLYAIVDADQRLNIRFIMPLLFLFLLGAALAIKMAPGFFLDRNGHLWLIGCQAAGLLIYLACVVRAFTRITPLISAAPRRMAR